MYIGLCLSAIDHDRGTRSEAREQVLKLKEKFGLTSVELILEGIGRRLAPYPWEWTEGELEEVKDFLKNFQRTGAHLPFFAMNVIAVNERVREEAMEQMRLAIEVAKSLNLDYGVTHATGTTEGLVTAREPHRQFLAFKRLAGFCEGSSLTLSIENAGNLHNIKACTDMVRSLKAEGLPVAMTFDTGHANIPRLDQPPPYSEYGTVADAMEACIDIMNNVHLHNNDGTGDQHRGLLDGSIDLKSCIQRLRSLNYQGSISIEARPEVNDMAIEIAKLIEWCED
jgi:sugar phosphate isomerase/epimerase